MNDRTFLFITCVNNEYLYSICMKHIQSLAVPSGYSVQLLPIRGARSITEAYNLASGNEAKYKIYLHQDTFILYRYILYEILALFQSNPLLGLLGLVGCKTLPLNGIWREEKGLVGKLMAYHNMTYTIMSFGEVTGSFEPVEAVDGFFMATQIDLPWCSDLFHGFSFYDVLLSKEFHKRGYLVGVPKQQLPWCLRYNNHNNSNCNSPEFPVNRRIFVQHDQLQNSDDTNSHPEHS